MRILDELLNLPPNHAYCSSLVLYCFHGRDSSQLRITNYARLSIMATATLHFPSVISVQYEQDAASPLSQCFKS